MIFQSKFLSSKLMIKNRLFLSFFICLLSLTQFSCVPKNNSKRIIVASSGKIESLDPARVTTLKSFQLLASLGDTLYVLNNDGQLVPELALGMPIISEDKLKITINLKENIYFHDGTQFDAEAMKFSINRFMRIGINKYILGDKINFIETPSKFQLVLKLNKPSGSINALLTSINLTPISPTFYKDYSNKFLNDNFVGTGKYFLKNFSNEKQVLEPNPRYWGVRPKNNGINFVGYENSSSLYGALKSKQIDVLLSNSIEDIQRNKLRLNSEEKKIREGVAPETQITFISLRTNSYPFNSLNIRLAISKSINRNLISKKVSYGMRKPLRNIVPPIFKEGNQDLWPEYNPLEARILLEKEGFCNGKKLKFPLTYRSNVPSDKLIALIIQEDIKNNLSDCISMDIDGVESTTMYDNLSEGEYPAAIYDWTGQYPDPEAYLKPLLSCSETVENICKEGESVYSGSFWASKEINNLFKESESMVGNYRLENLLKIEKIASESIPYIPIWISSQKAWSQNKISKPIFNGSGIISLSDLELINE